MKQTKQQKAKNNLKAFYDFKEIDFTEQDGVIYTISKDNYMEKCFDVYEELEMQRKEGYEASELILDEIGVWK